MDRVETCRVCKEKKPCDLMELARFDRHTPIVKYILKYNLCEKCWNELEQIFRIHQTIKRRLREIE